MFFCFIPVGSAQKIDVQINDFNTLLCKRWKFDHALDEGKLSQTSHMRDCDLVFYKNYDYGTIVKGLETKGSWCYNEDNKNIELTNASGDTALRIFLLEGNKLILISSKDIGRGKGNLLDNCTQFSPK